MDGSFNLSNNALQNQEQFSLTYDKEMAERFVGIFDGLYEKTTANEIVYVRALKANELVDYYAREKVAAPGSKAKPRKPSDPVQNRPGGACLSNF